MIQRDNKKLETLTAPNPRPLLVQLIENISIYQSVNARVILVHKIPTRDPTLSAQLLTADAECTHCSLQPFRSIRLSYKGN